MAATDLFAGTDRHATYNVGERIFGRGERGTLMYAVLEGAVVQKRQLRLQHQNVLASESICRRRRVRSLITLSANSGET